MVNFNPKCALNLVFRSIPDSTVIFLGLRRFSALTQGLVFRDSVQYNQCNQCPCYQTNLFIIFYFALRCCHLEDEQMITCNLFCRLYSANFLEAIHRRTSDLIT